MAVYEVFSHPELRRYKTNVCSRASFIVLICSGLTFISPLLIAYTSQGFWMRRDFYQEQADINFKHQLIVMLEIGDGTTGGATTGTSHIVWSTYQNFNQLHSSSVRIPIIKSREVDNHRDGKEDVIYLTLEMPMLDTEHVYSATLLMFFDYRLYRFSTFTMESMGFVHYESARPGAKLTAVGDLRTRQREYLGHRGINKQYDTPIIDKTSVFAEAFELSSIISNYTKRNFTTYFDCPYPLWMTGRGNGQPFVMDITMYYPEETLIYVPGFWQLIKWAWIQYVSVLIVFLFVFDRIKVFIFQCQIVPTIVDRSFKDKAV